VESQKNLLLSAVLLALIMLLLYTNGFFGFLGEEWVPARNASILSWILDNTPSNNTKPSVPVKAPLCSDGGLKLISTTEDSKDKTPPKLNNPDYGVGDSYYREGTTVDEIHTSGFQPSSFNVTFYVPEDLGDKTLIYLKAGTEDGQRGETTFYTTGGVVAGSCNISGPGTGGVEGRWGECITELNPTLLTPKKNNTLTVLNNVAPDIFGLSFMDYDYMEFTC